MAESNCPCRTYKSENITVASRFLGSTSRNAASCRLATSNWGLGQTSLDAGRLQHEGNVLGVDAEPLLDVGLGVLEMSSGGVQHGHEEQQTDIFRRLGQRRLQTGLSLGEPPGVDQQLQALADHSRIG